MSDWVNHAAVAGARNGSLDHTVAPDGTGGSVVDGSGFTATAGRLLVVFVEGSVTSTTPSGWTLPSGGSAVANSGLYLFYRTAAGSDSFTTTHNGSDYPVVFDFYEFAADSAFIASVAADGVSASGGAGPTLSGLTGTNWTAGVFGQANTGAAQSVTWDLGTEEVDTSAAASGTDGYTYSLTATDGNTAASAAYAATSTLGSPSVERLVVAVNAAAGPAPSNAMLRPAVVGP